MYCCSTTGSCRPLSSVSNTCRNTKLSAVILKFGGHCVRDLAPLCAAVCPVVRQGTMPILCLKHLQSACQSFGFATPATLAYDQHYYTVCQRCADKPCLTAPDCSRHFCNPCCGKPVHHMHARRSYCGVHYAETGGSIIEAGGSSRWIRTPQGGGRHTRDWRPGRSHMSARSCMFTSATEGNEAGCFCKAAHQGLEPRQVAYERQVVRAGHALQLRLGQQRQLQPRRLHRIDCVCHAHACARQDSFSHGPSRSCSPGVDRARHADACGRPAGRVLHASHQNGPCETLPVTLLAAAVRSLTNKQRSCTPALAAGRASISQAQVSPPI